jgi:hypothetical protein
LHVLATESFLDLEGLDDATLARLRPGVMAWPSDIWSGSVDAVHRSLV